MTRINLYFSCLIWVDDLDNKNHIVAGVWFMHCHLEVHTSWGLKMAWIVLNGKLPNQKLLPPPADLPKCWLYDSLLGPFWPKTCLKLLFFFYLFVYFNHFDLMNPRPDPFFGFWHWLINLSEIVFLILVELRKKWRICILTSTFQNVNTKRSL